MNLLKLSEPCRITGLHDELAAKAGTSAPSSGRSIHRTSLGAKQITKRSMSLRKPAFIESH